MWTIQDGDYADYDEPFIDESPSVDSFIDFDNNDIDLYGEKYNELLPEVVWSLIHNY